MMDMNSLLLVDFYKVHHYKMYPKQMSLLYSNFTPRKSRMPSINKVVVFGIQYAIKEYLIAFNSGKLTSRIVSIADIAMSDNIRNRRRYEMSLRILF